MEIKDKHNGAWGSISSKDNRLIQYDDGTTAPLTTDQVIITYGKYKGFTLSEVTDRGYLEWMHKSAVEKDDWFQKHLVLLRIRELQ